MAKLNENILPLTREYIFQVGEQIRLARRRRRLSLKLIAERTGLSRQTISKIEKGDPTVSFGAYAAVLHALDGMDKDLMLLAKQDKIGRQIQDINL